MNPISDASIAAIARLLCASSFVSINEGSRNVLDNHFFVVFGSIYCLLISVVITIVVVIH